MKTGKKVLAFVLAVCLLIGMPMSVEATGKVDQSFLLASAYEMPETWGTRAGSFDRAKTLSLYFTGAPLAVNTAGLRAVLAVAGKDTNKALSDEVYNGEPFIEGTLVANTAQQGTNNIVFVMGGALSAANLRSETKTNKLKIDKTAFDGDIDTIAEMVTLAEMSMGRLVFRIMDTSEAAGDGVIDGITKNGTTKLPATLTCTKNGNSGSAYDAVSVDVATYERGEMRLVSAVFDESARTLSLGFSGIVQYSGRANDDQYCGVRVVNHKGQFMGYDPDTKEFFLYNNGSTAYTSLTIKRDTAFYNNTRSKINTLTAADTEKIAAMIDRVAEYNATKTDAADRMRVVYLIQEGDQSKLKTAVGDNQFNGYVDVMWRKDTLAPLVADHSFNENGQNQRDVAMAELKTPEQVAAQASASVTMTGAKLVATDSKNSYLVMTFSEPVKGLNSHIDGYYGRSRQYWLCLYNGKDQLMNNNNGKLAVSGGTALKWQIEDVRMFDTAGARWVGTVKAAADKGNTATYAGLMNYLSTLKTEDGGNLIVNGELADGYFLQASAWDSLDDGSNTEGGANAGSRWSFNGLVDHITSLDGTKKLYASCHDTANARDIERAVCDVTDGGKAVTISKVEVYNNNQYLLTFNQPTVMTGSDYYLGVRVTTDGSATANPAGGYYQWKFTFAPYGDEGTQFIGTCNEKGYDEMAAIAQAQGKAVKLTFEDSDIRRSTGATRGRNRGIDGVYAQADPDARLLNTQANGFGDRTYMTVQAVNEEFIAVEEVKSPAGNQVVMTFSEPIGDFDGLTVTLTDQGQTYPATGVTVSGKKATFTFDSTTLTQDARIFIRDNDTDSRIDLGVTKKLFANYAPDTAVYAAQALVSVVSTEQISRNELVVRFSEAVDLKQKADGGPFMGLRLLDERLSLVWAKKDATGTTVQGAEGDGVSQAMQTAALSWDFTDDSRTAVKVVFPENIDIAAMILNTGWPASLADYKTYFVIEEKTQTAAEKNNFKISNITAAGDPTKQLEANKTGADGLALEVTNLMHDNCITVSDAEITGENEVSFKFSHAVNLGIKNLQGKTGTYYAGFRFVTDGGALYFYNPVTGMPTLEQNTKNAQGRQMYVHAVTGEPTIDSWVLVGGDVVENQKMQNSAMQWGAYLGYTDKTNTAMTAHLRPSTQFGGVYDLNALLNPTGQLKEIMDRVSGKIILRLEEKNDAEQGITCTKNGLIDSFTGKDGTGIMASPYQANWNDGLDLEIVGEPIVGGLTVEKVEIIADNQIKATFSAPIAFVTADGKDAPPFVALRLYNSDNKLIFWNPYLKEFTTTEPMLDENGKQLYRNQHGYTLEREGIGPDGTWIKFGTQYNTAMQWKGSWKWADESHTAVIYTLSGGEKLPVKNITEIIGYDFNKFIEGSYLAFDIEEDTPGMIEANGHVDNIVRADNPKIALDANFFPNNRDSFLLTFDQLELKYKPTKLTAKTEVINDRQIRVSFTQPVDITFDPFIAVRMIDKDGNLIWTGVENKSTPLQWKGSWTWDDESHRSLTWTIGADGHLGGVTLYELANWVGALGRYKDVGCWKFVIEEEEDPNDPIGRHNGLVDNVVSKDRTLHLASTYSKGLDGILTELDADVLKGEYPTLASAQAIDDQTIKLTFSQPVNIDDDVQLGVRYLTAAGESDVLTNGKSALFKGDWKYADESKTQVIWTLNSPNADNLTDIFNYNGEFMWNSDSRVAFVITDAEDRRVDAAALRIIGVRDLADKLHLKANFATKDYPMAQLDIEVLYDLPAPEAQADGPQAPVRYITNYTAYIVAAAAVAVVGSIVVVAATKKRKGGDRA